MAFTKIAEAERKLMDLESSRELMYARGWCEVAIDALWLWELGIEFEAVASSTSRFSGNVIFAPAWVCSILLHTKGWDTLQRRLEKARGNLEEQELLSADLVLDINATREVRDVARVYVNLIRQAREKSK